MATPSGSKAVGPHSAATPQSQPLLPNFSPAPRSVPSPAAQRQAGKSPFAVMTQAHTASSTTAQNHPTVGSSGSASKALLGSSPAAIMMNFESPLPMAFSLSQLGGVDGGIPMAPGISGLSGLGLMSLPTGPTDEEKWRRLTEVIDKIKSRPGRVSKYHVHALASRLGFDVDTELPDLPKARSITLAGRTVMLELQFSPEEEFLKAELQYPEPSSNLEASATSASAVFQHCLSVQPGQSSITNKLEKFAVNLEKLARIDKPHGAAGDDFNGFEAISGIYTSLHKLYVYERDMASHFFGATDDGKQNAIKEVTCKKSGRPRMNENGRIGLDLDYWITRRHVPQESRTGMRTTQGSEPEVFSVSVLCEAMQPGQATQAARISNAWISDEIVKSGDTVSELAERIIDWQDPPPTLVSRAPVMESSEGETLDQANGKLPNVRFVAKLEPPLLIPGEAATQSGILQHSSYHPLPSYITALLMHNNPLDAAHSAAQMPPREITATREVLTGAVDKCVKHTNVLRVRTYEQAILLHDVAFDHPKQLIELLPMLRQFALLNNLLQSSFPPAAFSAHIDPVKYPSGRRTVNNSIDITFSTSPDPQLTITFAGSPGSELTADGLALSPVPTSLDDFLADTDTAHKQVPMSVSVGILPNAQISVGKNNISGGGLFDTDTKALEERLVRTLDITADLDVWIEFVRHSINSIP